VDWCANFEEAAAFCYHTDNRRCVAPPDLDARNPAPWKGGRAVSSDALQAPNSTIDRIQREMTEHVRRYTVAIVAYYDGLPRQHATGTLVRFADHWFLVTAGHAIGQYVEGKEQRSDLRLFLENGVSGLVPLFGEFWATDSVRDKSHSRFTLAKDLWDIAMWDLDERTVQRLTNKSFLNRTNISITADVESGLFFLAGFPCSWSSADKRERSITFTGCTYVAGPHANPIQLADYDPRFHMALSLQPVEPMPALEGISGCSIWKLADQSRDSDWSADSAQVVAVQTGVYTRQQRAIKGTRWWCVVQAMGRRYPDLTPIFKVWLPGSE
jgi:hypothetical protein